MKRMLTLLALALPIFVFEPKVLSEDAIVFCQSGNSFLKARYGDCRRGERPIPFPTGKEEIARLKGQLQKLEEKITGVGDSIGMELHRLQDNVFRSISEIDDRVAVVEEELERIFSLLCPCNYHAIPLNTWVPPAFPADKVTLDWFGAPEFLCQLVGEGDPSPGPILVASLLPGPNSNTCVIQSGEYPEAEQYQPNPAGTVLNLSDAELVACAKSLGAYVTKLAAKPGIVVAGGPPYECPLGQN